MMMRDTGDVEVELDRKFSEKKKEAWI